MRWTVRRKGGHAGRVDIEDDEAGERSLAGLCRTIGRIQVSVVFYLSSRPDEIYVTLR